jgi:predicted AlkP superfamily pyrophosphatase or phosphodiesterase
MIAKGKPMKPVPISIRGPGSGESLSPLLSAGGLGLFPALVFAAFFPGPSAAQLILSPQSVTAPVRKVLIIGIDGLRSDALLAARAPRIKALMQAGSYALDAWSDSITSSGPGWSSLLTGVWHAKHGVRSNGAMAATYTGQAFPHFYRRLKTLRPDLRTSSIVNWKPINDVLAAPCGAADLILSPGDDDSVAAQASALLATGDPDVLFLHFDNPDHYGHTYAFSPYSPFYLYAIRRTDDRIGRVLDALDRRPDRDREEWLILVVTDHGGFWRHHGEDIPVCRRIPFIVSGDGAAHGESLAGAGQVDLAPTVMEFLGLARDPNWGWDGRPRGLRPMMVVAAAQGSVPAPVPLSR